VVVFLFPAFFFFSVPQRLAKGMTVIIKKTGKNMETDEKRPFSF